MTLARHVACAVLVATAAVGALGCLGGGDEATRERPGGRGAAFEAAGVRLLPVPQAVRDVCRSTQQRADVPILCPSRLPRPVRDLAGSTALPPPVLTAFSWRENGIDFSYSAETGRPRLDGPGRFFHLQVVLAEDRLPPGIRPAELGGKEGLLAEGSGRDYASESYFGNHWRFFWRDGDVDRAATLHDFGPRTEVLLDHILRDLGPVGRRSGHGPRPTPRGVRTIDAGIPGPVSIAVADRQVWVAGQGNRVVSGSWLARLDADTGRPVGERIRVARGGGMSALLAGEDGVWVAHRGIPGSFGLQLVSRGRPEPAPLHDVHPEIVALARSAGSLWLVDFGEWPPSRHRGWVVEPKRSRRIAVGRAPAAIAAAGGRLWVTSNLDDTVVRIDPRSARVEETIPVGDGPVGVAVGHGGVWVTNTEDGTVSRIDPARSVVTATIPVGRGPRGVVVGRDAVWVANSLDDTVGRIDPATNRVVETIPVGAGPTAVAIGAGALWVANNHDGTVTRIDP